MNGNIASASSGLVAIGLCIDINIDVDMDAVDAVDAVDVGVESKSGRADDDDDDDEAPEELDPPDTDEYGIDNADAATLEPDALVAFEVYDSAGLGWAVLIILELVAVSERYRAYCTPLVFEFEFEAVAVAALSKLPRAVAVVESELERGIEGIAACA